MSPSGQKYHRAREAAEEAGIVFDVYPPQLDSFEARTYWEYFSLLDRTRQYADGAPQPIVLRELTCYLDEEQITDLDHRADVIYFVLLLDSKYRELVADKAKRERDQEKGGKGKRGVRRR